MEGIVDANAQLDYIEFQILPNLNRYDAFVCYERMREKVISGPLECLLPHFPDAKALHSKGSNAKYKLTPPESTDNVRWFTKSTLIRFMSIIGSQTVLDTTSSLKNEMSQLEEARKFHLSLYSKGPGQLQSGDSDSSGMASKPKAEGSDASKNELLRAIDLRLTALEGELTTAFDEVTGSKLRVQEMTDVLKFSDHVGSTELRDSLRKYIELAQKYKVVDNSSSRQVLESDRVRANEGNNRNSRSCSSETPVKYGVSPAKAAQVERQSSTESEESSLSSEEERPSAERSRTLIRSASPRRSASPMRRVQIGRSGSRRSTAITIKSLNNFPVRERSFLPQDDSDDGEPAQTNKKTDVNVKRISVKDAINLFESKQGDPAADIQKARSLLMASSTASKSVLRRWSSVVGEDSSRCPADVIPNDDSTQRQDDSESSESSSSSPKAEQEHNVSSDYHPNKPSGLDTERSPSESAPPVHEETLAIESSNDDEKLAASAEWQRQKEAELNELLMKMMETKPAQSRNPVPDKSKRQSLPAKQRGGLYDHYKEKRDEKLRGETVQKKAEKDKKFKVMQQTLNASKSQLASASVSTSDAGKKRMTNKVQKPQKNMPQPSNPKADGPKVDVKKVFTKTASLPATRKSWPSMPSPRVPGGSPAKTPVSSTPAVTALSRRKSQPAPPAARTSTKVDTSEPRTKSLKPRPAESKNTVKSVAEKKQSITKPAKTAKSKVHSASDDSATAVKPKLYSKKGTVVPVEAKPFLRKGSKTLPSNNQVLKTKSSPRSQNTAKKTEDPIIIVQNEMIEAVETVPNSSDSLILPEESEIKESTIHEVQIPGITAESPQKFEADLSFSPVEPVNIDVFDHVLEPETRVDDVEEESTISPTAWVETEEQEDQHFAPSDHICQMGSPTLVAPVGVTSPRVRHSLSQMLLQETSEPDVIDWGNAENPPTIVYQKDAPKGLKRLLKFARKSKTDTNSTGWSSPSVFSEGEDDTDDSKSISRRNSENLLKKATLQSKNNGHQNTSYDTYRKNPSEYDHPAQASMNKINVQTLSQHILEGHASASPTMSRGSRSFFSLSAFKGSK